MTIINECKYLFLILFQFFAALKSNKKRSFLNESIYRCFRTTLTNPNANSLNWLRKNYTRFNWLFTINCSFNHETRDINGVQTFWFSTPDADEQAKIILYFHGGGFVLNCAKLYLKYCQMLANKTNTCVVLIDYKLAPESSFPRAHQDCLQISESILASHPNAQLQLLGDSAGGSLVLYTLINLYKNNAETSRIKSLSLISPWIYPSENYHKKATSNADDIINDENLQSWLTHYCTYSQAETLSTLAPQLSKTAPPIYIQYSSPELLGSQIAHFIETTSAQRMTISYDDFSDMYHNFQIFGQSSPEGKAANEKLIAFLSK